MARKKAGIGELIKSDMSRRNIGENATLPEFSDESALEEQQAAKPESEESAGGAAGEGEPGQGAAAGKAAEPIQPVSRPRRPLKAGESRKFAPLLDYITAEVESEGNMDEQEQQNFYDFMLGQAMRYMRGFNAGKRFHQG